MVSSDTPLHKLKNVQFRNILNKYIDRPIPDESTFLKTYVHICYQKTMNEIKIFRIFSWFLLYNYGIFRYILVHTYPSSNLSFEL